MSASDGRFTPLQRAFAPRDAIGKLRAFSNWASLAVAAFGVAIAMMAYESSRYDSLRNDVLGAASETRGYFVDHIAGHETHSPRASADWSDAIGLDQEAKTILDRAAVVWRLPDGGEMVVDGWRLPDGRSIGTDQVFPVTGWEWISPVFPEGDREGRSAACALQPGGELTVIGFSHSSGAALVEYSIRAGAGGAFCESGTLLFYSAATLLDRAAG